MSAKTFEGAVSIVRNTKGEVALKKDVDGKFTAENVVELFKVFSKLSKGEVVNKYSLFIAPNGTEPVLLANRYGNPYIALLPKREAGKAGSKVVKLA